MTDEQINAAIAEACGRRRNPKGGWYPDNGWKFGTQGILNYCKDLNAMHEAEMTLSDAVFERYYLALYDSTESTRWPVSATARQRAEAFLKTLGKWEEVQE